MSQRILYRRDPVLIAGEQSRPILWMPRVGAWRREDMNLISFGWLLWVVDFAWLKPAPPTEVTLNA